MLIPHGTGDPPDFPIELGEIVNHCSFKALSCGLGCYTAWVTETVGLAGA